VTNVAIRGCPRSGTHLGEWFLKTHFDVRVINSSRHREWREASDPEKVLLMVKDPVAWVISMHRYCWKLAQRQGKRERKGLVPDELTFGGVSYVVCEGPEKFWAYNRERLVEHRNGMMTSWLESKADIFLCPYESMIGNPLLILKLLRSWIGQDLVKYFSGLPKRPMTEPRIEGEEFDPSYYLCEQWRMELILNTQLLIRKEILR
jgi:hypothetical protein